MSKKQIRLKNILATASIAALIIGYSDAILAQSRRSQAGTNSVLSSGNHMDKDAARAPVPFQTGSTFQFNNNNVTITADRPNVNILAIDTSTKTTPKLNATEDVSIGSVIGTTKLTTTIQAGKKVTLTGTASAALLAPDGSKANQFVAAVNTYTALGNIDFTGHNAELIVDNSGLGVGEAGKEITLTGAFTNPANGILNVVTPLIVTDKSVAAIPKINIGKAESVPGAGDGINGILVLDSVNANLLANAGDEIKFLTAGSVLKIQNISVGGGVAVDLKKTLPVAADGTGIVELHADGVAGGKLTIADTAGAGKKLGSDNTHRLKELKISGDKEVEVNVGVFAKKVTLDGTGAVKFTEAVDGGAGSKLKFGAATPVTMDENLTVETIDFNDKDGTIKVADGKKLTATLTSTGGVKGKVKFAGAGELIGGAAAGANSIEEVKANSAIGTVFKISGKHKIKELTATNASTIEFVKDAELEGGINTTNGGAVKLDFKGNNNVTNGIGRAGNAVGDITLAGVNNKFKGDIYTSKITANNAEFVITDNTTVHGDFGGAGTTLNLGEKTLTLGDTALTGNVTFVVKTQAGGGDTGHVEVTATKAVNLSGAAAIKIEMHTADLDHVKGKTYTLIRPTGGAANQVPGALMTAFGGGTIEFVDATTGIITWSFDPATSTLTPRDNRPPAAKAASSLTEALVASGESRSSAEQVAASFVNTAPGSNGSKVRDGLSSMPIELREDAINDELPIVTTGENIAAVTSAVAEVITAAVSGSLTTISARMGDIASPVGSSFGAPSGSGLSPSFDGGSGITPDATSRGTGGRKIQQQSEAYGVAAGDEVGAKMGLWITPFYSSSIQKLRDQTPGYKTISTGGTIGFDGMVNDASILGAAFTYVDTNIKHRNEKVGDKTKAATYMGSLYGVQSFVNNFFAQGILSYSHNKIRNNEFRSLTKETARAKYNSDSYSGEVLLGKNFNIENGAAITPMAGIRYTKFYDKAYKETGASINNLTVKKKNSEKCEGILGARLTGINYINETTVLPEIHGFVNHDFIGKKPNVDARFDGSLGPLATRAIKPTKTFYNVGVGVTAKHRMMEYSIGYDAHLAKKYVGHQGMLKVRVNL